jgi:hypothetical protein
MVPRVRVFIPSIHEKVGGRARDYRPLVDKLVTKILDLRKLVEGSPRRR